ncbi:PIG-L deacetylase family protein [Ideonella sp. YS5]|uniref:PIG-L deacetylase family protein n=1 Tax=Ideonella sp. YS5 TaxID=3453714 RepID=UPI003EEF07D0
MSTTPDRPAVDLIVSPHLDDAVFSCGEWMATHPGVQVVTVFAGTPVDVSQATEWDRACGFVDARQALTMRRLEDQQAHDALGATPHWLEHCEEQYGEPRTADQIAATLLQLLRSIEPTRLLLPLGLYHRDHVLAHQATLQALAETGATPQVWAYEDVPHRRRPGWLQNRLCELRQAGIVLTPAAVGDSPTGALKDRAVASYVSQWQALTDDAREDTRRPERFWAFEPAAVIR